MSVLQEQAVSMIYNMSDDNVGFLIEVINRLIPEKQQGEKKISHKDEEAWKAFERLEASRMEIRQHFPDDFDSDRELDEARAERYDGFD